MVLALLMPFFLKKTIFAIIIQEFGMATFFLSLLYVGTLEVSRKPMTVDIQSFKQVQYFFDFVSQRVEESSLE